MFRNLWDPLRELIRLKIMKKSHLVSKPTVCTTCDMDVPQSNVVQAFVCCHDFDYGVKGTP